MNEFATMIQNADKLDENATIQMQSACTFLDSLSQPNSQIPRNVDSKKNAVRASIASGAPNTSPMKRAYSDQFIPKWNSCTIPVTTPIAKLTKKILPQNCVSERYFSSPVFTYHVSSIAIKNAKPSVIGTNKK